MSSVKISRFIYDKSWYEIKGFFILTSTGDKYCLEFPMTKTLKRKKNRREY